MEDIIIYSCKRTPWGRFNAGLSHIAAHDLAASCIRASLEQAAPVLLQDDVTEVIFGEVLTAGCGMNPARQAALAAGLSGKVTASTVNMVCGSGLKAIVIAAQSIRSGENVVAVAGGMESMSRAPHLIRLRTPQATCRLETLPPVLPDLPKFGDMSLVDSVSNDGLTDPQLHCKMGDTAELVALRFGVKRAEQDSFALRSHSLASAASSSGRFKDEIAPIVTDPKTGAALAADEQPRSDLSAEKLAKIGTVFTLPKGITENIQNGGFEPTITAGNCSSLNDGAASVVLVAGSFLKNRIAGNAECSRGLARLVSWAQSAGQPELMGIEPVQAVNMALSKAGWSVGDVDFWEINEAFAVTTLVAIKQLAIPDWEKRVNVNGGAIALGHPLGATGGRLVVTMAHQLAMIQAKDPSRVFRGVVTACIGGGQAIAACLESIHLV